HAARRAHACGYVDNARALPTYRQPQQSTTSINLILQKGLRSDPAHHIQATSSNASKASLGPISTAIHTIAASTLMNPVTLPPGRARLATKPSPTGSPTSANTIGIVRVCRYTAAVAGVVHAKITSG